MKNRELFALFGNLFNPSLREINDFKINYAIEKNKAILKPEIDLLKKLVNNIEGYMEYEKERIKLEEELKLLINKSGPSDNEIDANNTKISALESTNKSTIEQSEQILNTENKTELYKIKNISEIKTLSAINTSILFPLFE